MPSEFEARSRAFLRAHHPTLLDAHGARLRENWARVRQDRAASALRDFLADLPSSGWRFDIHDDAPRFQHPDVASLNESQLAALQAMSPWRKGPWDFAGTRIDAEWRSELKWHRILDLLPPLDGEHVIDVGSNNGYYAHRLLHHGARSVLALDPTALYVHQALAAEGLMPERPVVTIPDGLELLAFMPRSASLILLMGILYHHSDPLYVLRLCSDALAAKKHLLIETIVLPGEEPTALFVPRRYAGAKGFYWLPTLSCLKAWIQRANLRVVAELPPVPTREVEQRSTRWREGASLAEGLMESDPSRTIEGHPAPQRVALLCTRGA